LKKYLVSALAVTLGTSMAFAASLGVPFFVDNAEPAADIPHKASVIGTNNRVTTLITLRSNVATTLTCSIQYYDVEGSLLGPFGAGSTFTIAPKSSLAFRPVAHDPGRDGSNVVIPGGQEGPQGVLVPNRPTSDGKKNGSCIITWTGAATDVQGYMAYLQTSRSNGETLTMSYAHLLPDGTS
jgi:hypothetical protein